MNRCFPCLAGLLMATSACAQEDMVLNYTSQVLNSFTDSATTENWAGSEQTAVFSGIEDGAFLNSPVLQATKVAGAANGANVRPTLEFAPVVLDQPNKFVRMRLKLRFASGMVADRRLQLAFWDSSTSTGYLSYARAGTSTLTGNILRQPTIPALGVMNGGGTTLTTTGDRTVSLGTSPTVIRDATLVIYSRADNSMAIRVTCTNDAGEPFSMEASDPDNTFHTFDRFALTVWGNSVNVNIDEAELSTGTLVPPSQWNGLTSANWSEPSNWVANTVPADNARLVFGSSFLYESHNDLPSNTPFNGMEFTSDTLANTISGNAVRLGGVIRNASTAEQFIQLPVTLSSDLSVWASAGPVTMNGDVGGNFGLTKSGAQILTLSGAHTYTGATIVNAGTLSLTKAGLDDKAPLEITTGATVSLDFEGSDTVGSLMFDGVPQEAGTYSAATNPEFFLGTGSITIPSVTVSAYDAWIRSFAALTTSAVMAPEADPDGDGLPNYQEFAFGTDPSAPNVFSGYGKLDSGFMTLTIPVRAGATWSGTGPLVSSAVDGISYRLEGTTDPAAAFTAAVSETTALTSGLPGLNAGWEYRAFRLTTPAAASPRGFLRAVVTK